MITEAKSSRWRWSINSGASFRPSRIQESACYRWRIPDQRGAAGIRGQAGLEISWSGSMCALSAPITRVEITLPTGSLSLPLQIFGFGTTGCEKPGVTVTPFEAAEAAA